MGEYLTSYYNSVKYELIGDLGSSEISEPINWKEDEKEFKRSEDAHGVFINLSNNLSFYRGDEQNDGGYDFLKETYDIYGINATVLLKKSENVSGLWVESYRGYLDFSTYSRMNNIIEVKFNESGLYEKIKARRSEKLELDRVTTMDGNDIDTLSKETVALDGREILIVTEYNVSKSKNEITIPSGDNNVIKMADKSQMDFNHNAGGNYETIVIPMDMLAEQDGNAQTIYDYDIRENGGSSYFDGKTAIMFYRDADNDNILTIDFDIELEVVQAGSGNGDVTLELVKFNGGETYNYVSYVELGRCKNGLGKKINFSASKYQLNVLAGESYSLASRSLSASSGHIKVNVNKANMVIYDPTFYEKTTSEFLLPYEALDRIIHITTNQEHALKSKILGRTDTYKQWSEDGFASLMGITNGFWVRKFDDEKLTTSFKDFMESFSAVAQLGYGIEKIGFKEQVRVEHISHFYQDLITIRLDQPNDIKRTVASDYFYSSLELGYDKPSGDNLYEEAMGLDEYNVKSTYTTHISRVENKFEQVSKYRTDGYGKEFARRKPRFEYPEEDTNYDKDVFIMDLQRSDDGGANFIERKWAKDFVDSTNLPIFATGCYSPETAVNLRFSPINLLLRWGFWIKGGLEKYKNTEIRYSSSEGNSKLTTQLRTDLYPNSKEYSEDGNVLVSDLDKSLFIPEFIEFDYPVSSELLRNINSTSINKEGEEIMNYYGLVEFTNEDGMKEYGFLMELKPNGKGSWKLLKANKKEVMFNESTLSKSQTKPILTGYPVNIEI